MAAGGVNVNRRTSSTPHSVALPATKIRHLGSEGVLRLRFAILQGTGTRRTGRTLSDSNAAESQICGAKPCVPLSTEGRQGRELYIEVKTTTGPEESSIFITANELTMSEKFPKQYCLYRVYDFDAVGMEGKISVREGSLKELCISAQMYKVNFEA